MRTPLYILTIFLLLSCSTDNGPGSDAEKIDTCKCVDTLIVDSIHPKYPFDTAEKIVSYEFSDTLIGHYHDSMQVIVNGQMRRKHIVKEIDITGKKSILQHILINKTVKCSEGDVPAVAHCLYFPHHCIIFYDNKNRPIEYIEVCFMCDDQRTSGRYFGLFCEKTFCDLRVLFKNSGHNPKTLMLEQCL